jgi:hypothetical protein
MCKIPNICLLKSCRGHHLITGFNRRIASFYQIKVDFKLKFGLRIKNLDYIISKFSPVLYLITFNSNKYNFLDKSLFIETNLSLKIFLD